MDIEQLRKINEMSKTLQKHGIALSSEDGARLASQVHEERLPQADGSGGASQGDMISREMVEILVEREARKLRHKIDALEEKITELANRPAPKPSYIEVPRQEQSSPAQNQNQPAGNMQSQSSKPAMSSNSGTSDNSIKGRNPDEFDDSISVEKMFYYGSK